MHGLILTGLIIFVSSVPEADHIYTPESPAPLILNIGFIICQMSAATIFTVNLTLLSKSIASCVMARGVLLAAQAISTSCGTLLIDGLGGQIYDIDKRNPFFIVMTSESLVILMIIVLALSKQLRI